MTDRFVKMQGAGNDYIFIEDTRLPENAAALARKLSDRHFGIGGDGVVWMLPCRDADIEMRMFNADGSEGQICGNALRCIGRYCRARQIGGADSITVMTRVGRRRVSFDNGGISAELGKAEVLPKRECSIDGETFTVIPVSVGNPHGVVFTEDLAAVDAARIGAAIEALFDCNVEFVQVEEPHRLRVRVWERGSGITLACGSGSCAAAAAAVKAGRCRFPVTVQADGGILSVDEADGCLWVTGEATMVFKGVTADDCFD